jgi:methylmalonyl-CoA mutase N-terminal domain/subunit
LVNKYTTIRVSPESVRKQKARTDGIRKKRNKAEVKYGLEILRQRAMSGENLMNPIIACVRNYATVGEISDILRGVYGRFKERPIF